MRTLRLLSEFPEPLRTKENKPPPICGKQVKHQSSKPLKLIFSNARVFGFFGG